MFALELSAIPVRFFLDFNAVIVNLFSLSPENQEICLQNIQEQIKIEKADNH